MELKLSRPEVLALISTLNHMLHYLGDGTVILPADTKRFAHMRECIHAIMKRIMLHERKAWEDFSREMSLKNMDGNPDKVYKGEA